MLKKGFVFLCSDNTEDECNRLELFGGKNLSKKIVNELQKGDILFNYNYSSKKLIGIFEATSEVQENIVPDAWGGQFPMQVRVKRIEKPKPITREDIGSLLEFNGKGFPTARLIPETVDALIELFHGEKRIVQYDDGNRYFCKDGHKVKSEPEHTICDLLFEYRIPHAYEYPVAEAKRSDFFIPMGDSDKDGIYIEYWGMNDDDYVRNREHKEMIYKTRGLKLISINHNEARKIKEILSEKLREYGVKTA